MSDSKLSTDAYKGVRDFYPEDMAVQRYIFAVWSDTAESFGYERYDASILEPSDLYRAKGAENAEMVHDQTYTFTDRGGREVTLRPEMTPTVARMVAGRRRTLSFPLRWYSIPNVFRYERMQRGRLREHWQFNCDLFGADHFTADVEMIALAHQIFINFGADESMFEIRINNRQDMTTAYHALGIMSEEHITAITRLTDRKNKISAADYQAELTKILNDDHDLVAKVIALIEDTSGTNEVLEGVRALGITNAFLDRTIARGFDYYTGTVFEIVDTHPDNNRSMLGGGRYDNLTTLFGGEPISGIGFGMGDVTMRDFLETHNLLAHSALAPTLVIIPTDETYNLAAQKIAHIVRAHDIRVAVDIGTKKIGKKISDAAASNTTCALVIGEDETKTGTYTVKNLTEGTETTGTLETIIDYLTAL